MSETGTSKIIPRQRILKGKENPLNCNKSSMHTAILS
jgi:hypothetical protein